MSVGGDKRDRTADLLNAIQALSQLSYTPIFGSLSDSFCIIAHVPYLSRTFFVFLLLIFESLVCFATIANEEIISGTESTGMIELQHDNVFNAWGGGDGRKHTLSKTERRGSDMKAWLRYQL